MSAQDNQKQGVVEPASVSEAKKVFNQYFEMIGGKDFKHFYYDWHIDAMIEPFAELVAYFNAKYPQNPQEAFEEFVQNFSSNVDAYNVDCEKFCSIREGIPGQDEELSNIIDKIETFAFEMRQFQYSFGSEKDYVDEFGKWVYKPDYPYSHMHGLAICVDILNNISSNFEQKSGVDSKEATRKLVDNFLRTQIAREYAYDDAYTHETRKNMIGNFVALRNKMDQEFQAGDYSNFVDTFQIETKKATKFGTYRPNGFELEFYVSQEYGDYDKLISYLKDKHGWKHVYTTNADPSVYNDGESAGVIERDGSLAPMAGLAPVEYATRIMKSKEDEKECLKILNSFDKGYANVHCSLHQHVSAEGFNLDTYKRLVKRMMQHEAFIVENFAAPERRDNHLLFATYISRNLSSNDKRDYPFLCVMVDLCDNLDELREMVGFGHKYKTLNIMPSKTVEFRYMNAVFDEKFVAAFLQFNRDFVNSAVNNEGTHINRPIAHKFNWMQNQQTDDKTVLGHLSYYYQWPYDEFRPEHRVDRRSIHQAHVYGKHVAAAVGAIGKAPYFNSYFLKRMRDERSI